MLDFPASGAALWQLYDTTGIRPEYAIASMNAESGLDPSAVNSIGCAGLNQMCPQSHSLPPGYETWSASQQINGVIAPFWQTLVRQYGPMGSGARLEQANFYPASLSRARALGDVIVSPATDAAAYEANRAAFDPNGTGAITVAGIAAYVARAMQHNMGAVQSAIAQTYALRPGERPHDPVYGDLGGSGAWPWLAAGAVSATALAYTYAIRQGVLRRPRWL